MRPALALLFGSCPFGVSLAPRLCAVNTSNSLPLSTLLQHTSLAVQAVRAGRSLNDALAVCPAGARAGTQALAFHVLRLLGGAAAAREVLVQRLPPPRVDGLLVCALALLWPGEHAGAAYAAHTVVDQTVEAAKHMVAAHAKLVNAVLRRFVRERAAVVQAVQDNLVARYNHPRWWIAQLQTDWPDDWENVLAANQEHAPMVLRVQARRASAQAYVERLAQHGIAATVVGPQAVRLHAPCPVQALPGFADGDVSVQDAGAQRAAALLIGAGLAPGARVLDACAAPGGKTAHLLELAQLDVLALDVDAQRLARVDDTLQRLGLRAQTQVGDGRAPQTWWDGRLWDAILLDAPCSASGIVRRHPDVRWLRRASDIQALAQTQGQLLDALWPLLRTGGRLLYCTCSVFRAEGLAPIDAFLQRQPDAKWDKTAPGAGHSLPRPDNPGDGVVAQLSAAPDGFFYALLEKM
jgi:16S rRNA (cytosine967-C5)-methyltransferase